MCTVTFLPVSGNKVLLASNRDEKHWRSDAAEPGWHASSSGNILYPKDPDAGGTWIAAHENGNAVIFLNGGFERHERRPPYGKSRGLVLLDMIDDPDPVHRFSAMSLLEIEPFTAVVWNGGSLTECVWDGTEKHINGKDPGEPHLWSSATLYEEAVRSKRREWFRQWLTTHQDPGLPDLLDFHRFTGDGDPHNDLLMNRDGKVFTVSITGLELDGGMGRMTYLDLKNNRECHIPIQAPKS